MAAARIAVVIAVVSAAIGAARALVTLGPSHAGMQRVAVALRRGRVRFALPGLPSPVVFTGRVRPRRLDGTVRQGAVHGTFHLRPGTAPGLVARGFYTGASSLAVVD